MQLEKVRNTVKSFAILDKLPTDMQQDAVDFLGRALEICATAGYAPSQHNYAVMFNAPPGSSLAWLAPQDQRRFGYWTRMAAAQGEPRAIFNLAMRMVNGVPDAGIDKDPEIAYKLLSTVEQLALGSDLTPDGRATFQVMMPFVKKAKANIENVLGEKRVSEILATASSFNYAALAPTKGPHPAEWDHERNIRSAVENFLRMQDTSGNEAVVRTTKQCYLAARREIGLTKDREYCVAFDAANIEYTTFFYQELAKKYKSANVEDLQPEETKRSVGRRRIVREMTAARIENAESTGAAIYGQATEALVSVITQKAAQPGGQPDAAR